MTDAKNQPAPLPTLQAYKVNLSKGNPMPCDADELPNIILAIKTGAPCKIRSGIFNPSYYVSITEDNERIEETQRENYTRYQQNEHNLKYGDGKSVIEYKGLQPIKDIFAGVNLAVGNKQQLPQNETPQLPEKPKEEGRYKQVGT